MHCHRLVYLPTGCICLGGVPAQGVYLPEGCTCPWGCTCLGGVPALMAYFHQWRWIPNPIDTLYYAEIFPSNQIWTWIPVQRLFPMVTVPILGTDLRPNKPVYMKFSCFCLNVFPFLNNKNRLQKWRGVVF